MGHSFSPRWHCCYWTSTFSALYHCYDCSCGWKHSWCTTLPLPVTTALVASPTGNNSCLICWNDANGMTHDIHHNSVTRILVHLRTSCCHRGLPNVELEVHTNIRGWMTMSLDETILPGHRRGTAVVAPAVLVVVESSSPPPLEFTYLWWLLCIWTYRLICSRL